MKKTILALATLTFVMAIGCSDITTQPVEPQPLYVAQNSDGSYSQLDEIKERPNRDSVVKDTTEHKKDTTGSRKRDTVRKAPPTIFADLLIKLNLLPGQRTIVDTLLMKHKACVENCVKALKDAEAAILAAARSEEAEIKKAAESGTITKAQARKKLAELKKKVNESLKNLPIRTKVQDCIKTCDSYFINQLERILSSEQKRILKSWLESRAKRTAGGKKDTNPRG
jgi:hypothetical protein